MGSSEVAARRALDALARDQGDGVERLPWESPVHARRALDEAAARRRAIFVQRVRASWLTEAPHVALARALADLEPASRIVLYPNAAGDGPAWMLQSATTGRLTSDPIKNQGALPRVRLYNVEGPDPFADRPVSLLPLLRRVDLAARALGLVDEVLTPNDAPQQLRMITRVAGRVALYAGPYRRAREARFQLRDHALLYSVRPALRSWARIAAALGPAPIGEGSLVAALAAFDRPALLLRRGRVVFENSLASAHRRDVVAAHRAGRLSEIATSTPLEPGGLRVELVLPHAPRRLAPFDDLPPSLRAVADLCAEGLSDKDIAAALGQPLTTTRTYVTRVMARFGVRSRRDLMARRLRA